MLLQVDASSSGAHAAHDLIPRRIAVQADPGWHVRSVPVGVLDRRVGTSARTCRLFRTHRLPHFTITGLLIENTVRRC